MPRNMNIKECDKNDYWFVKSNWYRPSLSTVMVDSGGGASPASVLYINISAVFVVNAKKSMNVRKIL